jgi:DNA-binding response OmpR family regulator
MKLLYIEDEPSILELSQIFLSDEGYDISTACNGKEGIDLFMQALELGAPFDIVVTDYRMPFKDGAQVIKEILAKAPSQKIILTTAFSREVLDESKIAISTQVKILNKPFDFEALIQMVKFW